MGGCCVKGVPLTLRGRGDKLEICGPAPPPPAQLGTAAHPPPQLPPVRAPLEPRNQQAAEEGSSAPQRPGPVSAVGREGPGAQAVLLRGQPSVTVLRFLAQQDMFLLCVNLGIHTSVAC